MTATLRDPNEVPFYRGTSAAVAESKAYTDAQIATLGGVYETLGASAAAVSAHTALPDPHPQYLTPAEGAASYETLGASAAAVSAHTALPDPHPGYALEVSLGTMSAQNANAVAITGGTAALSGFSFTGTAPSTFTWNADFATSVARFTNANLGTNAVAALNCENAGAALSFGINGTNSTNASFGPANTCFVRSSAASAGLSFILAGTGNMDFHAGGTVSMRLLGSGRRLLVGPTLPTDDGVNALQVGGAVRASTGLRAGNAAVADTTLLDWYQEGTFTPVVFGSTSAGAGTYSRQSGRYQRVGNQVHVTISCVFTGHTGTGDLRISGLPFASSGSSQGSFGTAFIHGGPSWVSGSPSAYLAGASSIVRPLCGVSGATFVAVQMSAAGDVAIFLTYEV